LNAWSLVSNTRDQYFTHLKETWVFCSNVTPGVWVFLIVPSGDVTVGGRVYFPRSGIAERVIVWQIVNNTKTVALTRRTSKDTSERRHLEDRVQVWCWCRSDVVVGWDPMGYVPSRWLTLYPLDPSALRHDPYWTGIKFLRRPPNCHQDYVADSSAYTSLSHDPTATPFLRQQHQDM